MKKFLLISVFLLALLCTSLDHVEINADSNTLNIYSEAEYFLSYEVEEDVVLKKVDLESYNMMEEIKNDVEHEQVYVELFLELHPEPIETIYLAIAPCPPGIPCDDMGGGSGGTGSDDIDKVFQPDTSDPSLNEVNCDQENYATCKVLAEATLSFTILETSVLLDPDSDQVHLKSTMTWNDSPIQTIKDFMSLSWRSDLYTLYTMNSDATGTTKVWFDYTQWGFYNSPYPEQTGSDFHIESETYSPNSDDFEYGLSSNGIIWNIDKIYKDYDSLPEHPDLSYSLFTSGGVRYHAVDITKQVHELECSIKLDSTTAINRDNTVEILSQHTHTYFGVNNTSIGVSNRAYFDKPSPFTSFLSFSLQLGVKADEGRQTRIVVYFD
jgi:hypothetical protein